MNPPEEETRFEEDMQAVAEELKDMPLVYVHTDGGCEPNPGLGAWAAIIEMGVYRRTIAGTVPNTTNNRMELMAAIRALRCFTRGCRVLLISDSQYLVKGMSIWMNDWKRDGRMIQGGNEVKNLDLWKELEQLAKEHIVDWYWVSGHLENLLNNECDFLVREALARHRRGDRKEQDERWYSSLALRLREQRRPHDDVDQGIG